MADYDGSVTIADSYCYDGYGVLLQDNSVASANPSKVAEQQTSLLYAGEQFDTSAQQYYLRARYYDPLNGRFNQIDPYAGNNQDPQSLHKYLYCHANPINAVDPSGMFSLGEMLCVATIVGCLSAIVAGEIVRIQNGTQQQINSAQWRWFKIGFAAGLIIYGGIWAAHSLWTMFVSGGIITAQQSAKQGYSSHEELVEAWKAKGYPSDYAIHHFVQQTTQNITRFGNRAIHSLRNSWPVDPKVHSVINSYQNSSSSTVNLVDKIGYYSRMFEYIQKQPWETQYLWGIALCEYVVQNGTWMGFVPPL